MVFSERYLVPILHGLLLISCPSAIWFPWFPCADCYKREACSKHPDAILPDFHSRRWMFLAKTQWLQPAFLPNAAVHCTPWYQGVIVWFKTQVEVSALLLVGTAILCQPHRCTCGCGSSGVTLVSLVQLLLEDTLLWSWLNTALMSHSFKQGPLKPQGSFNRL